MGGRPSSVDEITARQNELSEEDTALKHITICGRVRRLAPHVCGFLSVVVLSARENGKRCPAQFAPSAKSDTGVLWHLLSAQLVRDAKSWLEEKCPGMRNNGPWARRSARRLYTVASIPRWGQLRRRSVLHHVVSLLSDILENYHHKLLVVFQTSSGMRSMHTNEGTCIVLLVSQWHHQCQCGRAHWVEVVAKCVQRVVNHERGRYDVAVQSELIPRRRSGTTFQQGCWNHRTWCTRCLIGVSLRDAHVGSTVPDGSGLTWEGSPVHPASQADPQNPSVESWSSLDQIDLGDVFS